MRGQREKECLEAVKQMIFYNRDGTPCWNVNGENFLTVSDEEFQRHSSLYMDFHNHAYGLKKEDRLEVANFLRKARPNQNPNAFPDFVFEGGFIEHFQVTSSRENRNGASETREENEFQKKVSAEEKQFVDECNQTPCFDQVRSKQWERNITGHSYENLEQSFHRNIEAHLKSLEKYDGNKTIGVFLIENQESVLNMVENIFVDWVEGMSHGDLCEQQSFNCYRLSRDKNLLQYLYGFKDKIKYVIYTYLDYQRSEKDDLVLKCIPSCEVIKIESIPYILKLLPWDFMVIPRAQTAIHSTYSISVKGDKTNDKT